MICIHESASMHCIWPCKVRKFGRASRLVLLSSDS
uniref:Uncharacterized protein n=1 Tax=Arundo donax TaxID=35708 RepID=A0A0A9EY98_ARUDO